MSQGSHAGAGSATAKRADMNTVPRRALQVPVGPGTRRMPPSSGRSAPAAVAAVASVALLWVPAVADPGLMCGPCSLHAALEELHVRTTPGVIAAECLSGQQGTSLQDLQRAAERRGVRATVMKLSAAELAGAGNPAVALLWGEHFVAAKGRSSKELTVTDAPLAARDVSVAEFAKVFTGFALLLASPTDRIPEPVPASGPDLRAEPYVWHCGPVVEGVRIQRSFVLENRGSEPVVISEVRASCGCTTATLSSLVIPPGGREALSVAYNSTGKSGRDMQTVHLFSNDPVVPDLHLVLDLVVAPPAVRVSPKEIDFGEQTQASTAKCRLRIALPPDVEPRHVKVLPASPLVLVTQTADAQQPQECAFEISLAPAMPVGRLESSVRIAWRSELSDSIVVPVLATVVGDLLVTPKRLFFGLVQSGSHVQKSCRLRSLSRTPFKVLAVRSTVPQLTVSLLPLPLQTEWEIRADLAAGPDDTFISGTLLVETDRPEQLHLALPVNARANAPAFVPATPSRKQDASQ